MDFLHKPVLLHEVIAGLDIKQDDTFLDGTINGGGHSKAVYDLLGAEGTLVGIDLDGSALVKSEARLAGGKARLILKEGSFRNLDSVLDETGLKTADKILLDLGLSSNQFEESGRGFSFQKQEPLVMTFRHNPGPSDLSAGKIVNDWDEENIAQIIESYGEERFAKKIARAIVFARARQEIKTAAELAKIIAEAVPKRFQRKIHPATKTFQALRMTVNDELGSLKDGLEKGFARLTAGGRMAVISFHSLEDRMVKNFFRQKEDGGQGKRITKKPIIAARAEVIENPRSRSAKLRIIQKNY